MPGHQYQVGAAGIVLRARRSGGVEMPAKRDAKGSKRVGNLTAVRAADRRTAGNVRGGARDAASGLPTGKRMHKP